MCGCGYECFLQTGRLRESTKTRVENDYYGGYHKIKHFACHRDFLLHEIPCIKHTQNAPFPSIKHFRASHWLKNRISHLKCFIPGYEAFCVCCIHGISCKKKSLWQAKCFIIWYPQYFRIIQDLSISYGTWNHRRITLLTLIRVFWDHHRACFREKNPDSSLVTSQLGLKK